MQGLHAAVVDDSALFRRGVSDWLRQERATLVADATDSRTQVVFIGLSRESSLAWLTDMRRDGVPVIAFVDSSAGGWLHALIEMIPVGAILHRTAPESVVRDAVTAALLGSQYIDREIIPVLTAYSELRLAHYGLTARELEVAMTLADGRSNKEIAAALGVTVSTAKQHVAVVMRKTHSQTRHDAARIVRRAAGRLW